MKLSILAKRQQDAINSIQADAAQLAKALGLPKAAAELQLKPKAPDQAHANLFVLETVADFLGQAAKAAKPAPKPAAKKPAEEAKPKAAAKKG